MAAIATALSRVTADDARNWFYLCATALFQVLLLHKVCLMASRKTALQNRSKFLPNIIDSVFRVAGNHRTRRAAIECSEENKPFVLLDD
jgi:hypothetical protein